MVKSLHNVDELKHVRFVGRPTIKVYTPPKPANVLARHQVRPADSERADEFISWIFQRVGLTIDSYRNEPLRRRIPACLRALHSKTKEQARQMMEEQPELLPKAINTLLISVTEFFRDPPVFTILKKEVLPGMSYSIRPLRIWSAGCSSGEELYSVAILLAQAGLLEGSFLLGSDCRHDAIEYARAAFYNSTESEKIEAAHRHRYFDEVDNFRRPKDQILQCTHWKVADLMQHIEEGPWDIILWRNMAIYLSMETADSLWRGLVSVLAPGGVLIAGKAERPPEQLPLVQVSRCIYRLCSPDESRAYRLRPLQRSNHNHQITPETSL